VPALRPAQNPMFPALILWYAAMDQRVASYRGRVKGDAFSAARQLARDDAALSDVALESAARILVQDSWKDAMAEDTPASWYMFTERFPSVAKTPKLEAAAYLYNARDALRAEAGMYVYVYMSTYI